MSKLFDKVKEIAAVSSSLPENLQQSCFEILLKYHLSTLTISAPDRKDIAAPDKKQDDELHVVEEQEQADLTDSDIHLKVRRFMEKNNVTFDEINNIFYKDGKNIKILYEDLGTTKMAVAQIRIALLQSLYNAFETGEFQAVIENVREECRDRKCHNSANFAVNFNNNSSFFDFDKYTKSIDIVKLSEEGKQELASLIKELQ